MKKHSKKAPKKEHAKAKCPMCRGNVAINPVRGTFRKHKAQDHEMYRTGNSRVVPYCEAGGLTPAAAADQLEALKP